MITLGYSYNLIYYIISYDELLKLEDLLIPDENFKKLNRNRSSNVFCYFKQIHRILIR